MIHFLWQGAFLAALLLLVQAVLRRSSANARYVAACLALLLMAVCPLATFSILAAPKQPSLMPASMTISSVQERLVATTEALPPIQAWPKKAPAKAAPEPMVARLHRGLPWIVASWLGVVSLLSLRLLLGYSRVRRIKSQACESLGVSWTEKLTALANQLRVSRPVRLCQSVLVEVPTVIGWLRPVIIFPASALAGLDGAQLEAILAHELAHIRRHDYLVNILQNVIETLLFYHPAVWWVSRQISQERELCCDDLTVEVCGDRINYAKALATLEEQRGAAPGLALAAGGGSLLPRIRRLAGLPVETNRSGWWLVGTMALVLVGALIFVSRSSLIAADPNAAPNAPLANSATVNRAQQFLQDARLLVGMGKLDEAEAKLNEALKHEPESKTARYYLNYVRNARPVIERMFGETARQNAKAESRWDQTLSLTSKGRLSPGWMNSLTNMAGPLDYALLYGNLEQDEARRIVTELEQMKISHIGGFSPNSDRSSIYISQNQVETVRRHLATQGMPKSQGVGFDIFDKPAEGMSDFVQLVNYMRALEGELARTIAQIDGIESAKVKIVKPENRLLPEAPERASASVFVKARGITALEKDTVNAIRFLVANSVEGTESLRDSPKKQPRLEEFLPKDRHNRNQSDGSRLTLNATRSFQLNLSAATENLSEALMETLGEGITETNLFAGFAAYMKLRGISDQTPGALLFHDNDAPAGSFIAWAGTVEELNAIDRAVQFLNTNSPAKPKSPPSEAQPKSASKQPGDSGSALLSVTEAFHPAESNRLESASFPLTLAPMSALERELSRLVTQMDGIEAAKVMIVHPVGDLKQPSAQVFLKRRGNIQLDANTVNAIRFLVANSVEGLKPGAVAVADDAGNILSNPPGAQTPTAPSAKETASAQINDARILIELGKLDEAETKLQKAVKLEPDNKRARSYLNFVKEMRQATKSEVQTIFKQALADFEKAQASPEPGLTYQPGSGWTYRSGSAARQAILQKLDSIVLDTVSYDDVPLSEVVKDLSQRARKISPPGINFIINSQIDIPPPPLQSVRVDPVTGQPLPAPAAPRPEPVDLNKVSIRLNPPLRKVKLIHILDAVTKVSDPVLKYLVEDYAVVFTQKGPGSPALFTRTFRLDPATFTKNLGEVLGHQIERTNLNETVRSFFKQVGVDMTTPSGASGSVSSGVILSDGISDPPPNSAESPTNTRKAVFFNDRTGILFVRATREDLGIIEQALAVLNHAPPQVQIDLKWVELSEADGKALGFDWFLGNTRISSQEPASSQPSAAASSTNSPPAPGLKSETQKPATNVTLKAVTGILTDAQFRTVLRALQQTGGVNILAAPSVTTLSGRPAKIEVTQPKEVIRELVMRPAKRDLEKPDVYKTETVSVGPSVDITPQVMEDGRSIQIKIDAGLVEFVGYDDPGPFKPASDGQPMTAVLPLPRFRIRNAASTASLWDGQTVVLSGFLSRETRNPHDKVPVLGDLPLLGRLFRGDLQTRTNKHLILFVTPTIVDAAGNRVHQPQHPETTN